MAMIPFSFSVTASSKTLRCMTQSSVKSRLMKCVWFNRVWGLVRMNTFYMHTNRHQPPLQLWECSVHPDVARVETDRYSNHNRNNSLSGLILGSLLQVLTWWFEHMHFVKSSCVQYILLAPSGILYACGAVLQVLAYFSEPNSIYLAGNEQKNVLWLNGFWHRHSGSPRISTLGVVTKNLQLNCQLRPINI